METYARCLKFIKVGSAYRRRALTDPKLPTPAVKNHLDHCIDRVMARILTSVEKSKLESKKAARLDDLKADCASVDENENILMDESGNIKIKKEQQKILTQKVQELQEWFNEQPVAFEPYMVNTVPGDLSIIQMEAFRGFVLPENYSIPDPFKDEEQMTEEPVEEEIPIGVKTS